MSARLIVSLSGIRDKHLDKCSELVEALDRREIPVSLLVSPRRGEKYRLADDKDTQEWIRARKNAGDAIVLGGYDEAATKRRRAEFATIGRSEAHVRLTAAARLMDGLGLSTPLFAPPRWVASPGAMEALPKVGFRMCADLSGIHDLERGSSERGRMLSLGEGFVADSLWCRAMVAAAGRIAGVGGLVRVNIAAKHLQRNNPRTALFDAVDVVTNAHGGRAIRYEWRPLSDDSQGRAGVAGGSDVRGGARKTAAGVGAEGPRTVA